jgi:hypothetical protein
VWPTNFDGERELLFLLCFGLGVVAVAMELVEKNRDVHELCTLALRSSATAAP